MCRFSERWCVAVVSVHVAASSVVLPVAVVLGLYLSLDVVVACEVV